MTDLCVFEESRRPPDVQVYRVPDEIVFTAKAQAYAPAPCRDVEPIGRLAGSWTPKEGGGWVKVRSRGSRAVLGWAVVPDYKSKYEVAADTQADGEEPGDFEKAVFGLDLGVSRLPVVALTRRRRPRGLPDLHFGRSRLDHGFPVGASTCDPAAVYAPWKTSIENAGPGVSPPDVELRVVDGTEKDTRHETLDSGRGRDGWATGWGMPVPGLWPGRSHAIESYEDSGGFRAHTRLILDPANKVRERNERNNSVTFGGELGYDCTRVR